MRNFLTLILLAALLLTSLSCRIVKTLTGEDQNLKKVGDLWSDVPKMEGLASSEEGMPIYVKLLMRSALNNLYRLNNANEDRTHGTGDWAVFSTTKSPQDVQSFYTNDRMTTFGKWEASKNSTCLNGSEYHFSGVACVFSKSQNKKGIGLLIVAAQDEQKKQTNVFFVRVETDETTPSASPTASPNVSPNATRGEIKSLSGTALYGIEKRPMPAGVNLDELLPKQVGAYARTLLEKSDQRGVTPSSIEIDGNSVYATYADGKREIFVEFSVSTNPMNAQTALDVAASEVTDQFPVDPRFGSIGTEPSYLRVDNQSGAFFAWTRGNYYFSANAKGGTSDLDAFMESFPY